MRIVDGQPLNWIFRVKFNEFPDAPNRWSCQIVRGSYGGAVYIGLGAHPGEAINHALLHAGVLDQNLMPSDTSGD